ncbi:hypothetical protein SAMN02910292_01526 [Lachnospiraceae bacterium XBB2008]|nr:hypothetical protein SAMN02910292_01526 [Lachnospiraceae bacterium XBB2008]
MNENAKLESIKRSCSVGETVANIFCIIAIVGCVLALVSGCVILKMGREFDDKIAVLEETGKVSFSDTIGGYQIMGINLGDASSIESDIPAVQEALKDHPYCIECTMALFGIAIMTAILAVMAKLAGSVFKMIRKEDNPFTDKVINRVVIVLIVFSAILFLTSGIGKGILCGILTWVVYTILDYGRMLQIQSDETL